jgi:hypothetical protein
MKPVKEGLVSFLSLENKKIPKSTVGYTIDMNVRPFIIIINIFLRWRRVVW